MLILEFSVNSCDLKRLYLSISILDEGYITTTLRIWSILDHHLFPPSLAPCCLGIFNMYDALRSELIFRIVLSHLAKGYIRCLYYKTSFVFQ